MDIAVVRRATLIVACLVLFSTCGELETLFPSNETYQVRTLVNGSSLEECSIIRSKDKIRPYFAVSVVNDPDLIGLLVYIQDSKGKIIGDRVQYTLLAYADDDALTEADFLDDLDDAEEIEAAKPQDAEKVPEKTNDPEDGDEPQVLEKWSFTDTKPLEKNTDIEIAVKSLSAQLPYFPLPKELEIGTYVLVFEALGKKETLSRTETNVFYLGDAEFNLKDIGLYLSGLSGPQLISPKAVIMLESKLDFDRRLDPYVIWYNGKTIISEGKISEGAGKLLWEAPEQAGFYSVRLEAFPFYLKRTSYTGLSREIALPVSPKAISLGYYFENNYDHTARSPLSAGTAYKALQDADTPLEETPAGATPAYPAPELLQWYQFEGSLNDSLASLFDEPLLLPVAKTAPRWAAAGQSYGLAIGPDDPYLLSPLQFFRAESDQGGGVVLLHIRPLSEGSILSAFFPLESSSTEGVWMDITKVDNTITLRLSDADTFVDLPVYLTFSAAESLIPIVVEFYIRPYRLEAKISLDEYLQNKVGEIKLLRALSGEGTIRLGGKVGKTILEKPVPETTTPAASTVTTNAATANAATANAAALTSASAVTIAGSDKSEKSDKKDVKDIKEETFDIPIILNNVEELSSTIPTIDETFADTIWDELAILYSAVPLLPEELVANSPLETKTEETSTAGLKPADTTTADAKPVAIDIPLDAKEPNDADNATEETAATDTLSAEDADADTSLQEQETHERTDL